VSAACIPPHSYALTFSKKKKKKKKKHRGRERDEVIESFKVGMRNDPSLFVY
jgi:hypothetical protein